MEVDRRDRNRNESHLQALHCVYPPSNFGGTQLVLFAAHCDTAQEATLCMTVSWIAAYKRMLGLRLVVFLEQLSIDILQAQNKKHDT